MVRLKSLKLLNDFDFSVQRASYRLKERKEGLLRVEADLERHGVSGETAAKALRVAVRHTPEKEAAGEALSAYLKSRPTPQSRKEWGRLLGFLARKGFSEEAIRGALAKHGLKMDDPADEAWN